MTPTPTAWANATRSAEDAARKSAGCITCHQNVRDPHFKDTLRLGCTDCHGGDKPEAHASSDQVLLLIHGELSAEIGGKRSRMKAGDVVIIPPRVKHRSRTVATSRP